MDFHFPLVLGVVPVVMAIAAALGAVVSGIGLAVAAGDRAKARSLRQQAADQYGEDVLPVLDPLVAEEIGPTEFAAIAEDSSILQAQKDTLGEFGKLYESGGMGPGDMAALQLADEGVSQRVGSDYATLQQTLAQRGQANNPALMAAMAGQAGQTAANAQGRNRLQALAGARERGYDALKQRGMMAGSMRDDDWRRENARATAQDVNNRFNANMRASAAARNQSNAMRAAEIKAKIAAGLADNQYEQAADTQAGFNAAAKGVNEIGSVGQDMYDDEKKKGGY